jgi:hypothetical protein
MEHEYKTLNRCVREIESTRFESWPELRAFKRQYTVPRLKRRNAARARKDYPRALLSRRILLFNKIASYARVVAKNTERDW